MKWVGLGTRFGLSDEELLKPTDGSQPTILGKAQSCAVSGPACLEAHLKGKEPLVHSTWHNQETSSDESSSEDEHRDADWVDAELRSEEGDGEAPAQGGIVTVTASVMEVADIDPQTGDSGATTLEYYFVRGREWPDVNTGSSRPRRGN